MELLLIVLIILLGTIGVCLAIILDRIDYYLHYKGIIKDEKKV